MLCTYDDPHMCYILAAELLVSTDARSHIYAQRSRHSIFTRYTKKLPFVFLQNGVTALKRVDFFYGKGKPGSCDLFVVTSEKEKQIVIDNFDYEPDEVINTGFARWDVLKDKSQNSHDILVMPTWRSWLEGASDREFEESLTISGIMQHCLILSALKIFWKNMICTQTFICMQSSRHIQNLSILQVTVFT